MKRPPLGTSRSKRGWNVQDQTAGYIWKHTQGAEDWFSWIRTDYGEPVRNTCLSPAPSGVAGGVDAKYGQIPVGAWIRAAVVMRNGPGVKATPQGSLSSTVLSGDQCGDGRGVSGVLRRAWDVHGDLERTRALNVEWFNRDDGGRDNGVDELQRSRCCLYRSGHFDDIHNFHREIGQSISSGVFFSRL